MTKNKDRRIKLTGIEAVLGEHRQKVHDEVEKARPDWGAIRHWAAEAQSWQLQADRLRAKLPRGR